MALAQALVGMEVRNEGMPPTAGSLGTRLALLLLSAMGRQGMVGQLLFPSGVCQRGGLSTGRVRVFPGLPWAQGIDQEAHPSQHRWNPEPGHPWTSVTSPVDVWQLWPDVGLLAYLLWSLRAAWSCCEPLASVLRWVGPRPWQGK